MGLERLESKRSEEIFLTDSFPFPFTCCYPKLPFPYVLRILFYSIALLMWLERPDVVQVMGAR